MPRDGRTAAVSVGRTRVSRPESTRTPRSASGWVAGRPPAQPPIRVSALASMSNVVSTARSVAAARPSSGVPMRNRKVIFCPCGTSRTWMLRWATCRSPTTSKTSGSRYVSSGRVRATRATTQRWPLSDACGVHGSSTSAVEYPLMVTNAPPMRSAVAGVMPVDGSATNAST